VGAIHDPDKALGEKRNVTLHTVNHYFSLLKTLPNFAMSQEQYPGPNPVKEVKPYVVDRKRRSYSAVEGKKILEGAVRAERQGI
jgi:hypothetical protein